MDNTSGQGSGAALPDGVGGLCWSGFLWNWIWGLLNRVWFSLLVFVPVVGMLVPFVLLLKGRQWAWENKSWESVDHFNSVQRKWTMVGLVLMIGALVLGIAAIMFVGGLGDTPETTRAAIPEPAARPTPSPAAPAIATKVAMVTPAPVPASAPPAAAVAPTAPVVAVAVPVRVQAATPSAPAPALASVQPAAAVQPASITSETQTADKPRVRRAARPGPELLSSETASQPEPKIHTPAYNDVMSAVLRPDLAGVTELLDLGRWVDKPDSKGVTSLMAAVRMRDEPMAALLLARGADPNASMASGITPLSIARDNRDVGMITLLQRSGAK
jgi:hypothetical protein